MVALNGDIAGGPAEQDVVGRVLDPKVSEGDVVPAGDFDGGARVLVGAESSGRGAETLEIGVVAVTVANIRDAAGGGSEQRFDPIPVFDPVVVIGGVVDEVIGRKGQDLQAVELPEVGIVVLLFPVHIPRTD